VKKFYQLLGNSLIAGVTNNFVWFALTFWIFLGTQSVLATSYLAGIFTVFTAVSGFWFGAIVDHNKKKIVMLISSLITLGFFIAGLIFYISNPESAFTTVGSPSLWILVFLLMLGVVAGNIRNIALPTTVTILVEEDKRDKANGLTGSMMGISFSIISFASGLILAYGGMSMVLYVAVGLSLLSISHLFFISIPEKNIVHIPNQPKIDIKGTFKIIQTVPGLFALLFFATINNFLGGVFMSLMDAYGLTLVSVQIWGILWGFLSMGFIVGGFIISKRGLGKNPLRTMFLANICMWIVASIFTIQPWVGLLAIGMFLWISLVPFVEAAEQTIIQKVVPPERQGRVFGFGQSLEQLASPFTAFLIGPIAQFIFIPFMTDGPGVDLIGSWYGTGTGRGIALVFTITGIIGLIVTIISFRSTYYHMLSKKYLSDKSKESVK
jgi:DHA3 family multidrug efflux protein-like MFS transporter